MSGKTLRLNRLIHIESKRFCIVPIDHGTTLGPINGLENAVQTISNIVEGGADGLVMHKGLLSMAAPHPGLAKGRYWMHLSVSTVLGPDPNYKVLVATVEETVKLGADGISIHVNIGTESETEMIKDFGKVSEACLEWGMPLLAMMYSKKDAHKDAGQIAHAARLGQELGADIVKVDYPGTIEGMARVVNGVQVPVVIAGDSKTDNPGELLGIINDAIQAGAAGVSIGRNIFQYKDQRLITEMIAGVVHKTLQFEDCLEKIKESS
ncbi:2-amino-3,7-dideoxy-D-threo-hept-6-ulosonate synthase [Acidobacteriota bacterium]